MALTELYNSRNWQRTQDGDTVELVYTALWTDWEAGTSVPKIGDAVSTHTGWSTSYDYLRCSDVQCQGIDNEQCSIFVLFSTANRPERPRAKDERAWRLEIDVNSVEQEVTHIYDTTDATWKLWGGDNGYWHTKKPSVTYDDNETVPPIYLYKPSIVMRLTAYSDAYYPVTVLNKVGTSINSNETFHDSLMATPNININVGSGELVGNDANVWLFASCPIRMMAKDLYEYSMTFVHAGHYFTGSNWVKNNWNWQNGIAVNLYKPQDFLSMLSVLKGASQDDAGGGR